MAKAKSETDNYHSLVESRFLNPGFDYWFSNHKHVRSPFKKDIETEVRKNTSIIFMEWIKGLENSGQEKTPDSEFAEIFENILFNEAMKLTDDDDQRLTISYPFMPRVGDIVRHKENGDGKIIERRVSVSESNRKMFEVTVSSISDSTVWKTQFEIPV
ncbi:MAG: hypothetical protein IPJ16_16380 [Bacteroidales bacterium]|nr:hypothetical protein [Bacteroidales bacterium]